MVGYHHDNYQKQQSQQANGVCVCKFRRYNCEICHEINRNLSNLLLEEQDNDSNASMDECVKSMMKTVSKYLSPALRSIRIDEQTKIDDELCKVYSEGLQEESMK